MKEPYICEKILKPVSLSQFCRKTGHCLKSSSPSLWIHSWSVLKHLFHWLGPTKSSSVTPELRQAKIFLHFQTLLSSTSIQQMALTDLSHLDDVNRSINGSFWPFCSWFQMHRPSVGDDMLIFPQDSSSLRYCLPTLERGFLSQSEAILWKYASAFEDTIK